MASGNFLFHCTVNILFNNYLNYMHLWYIQNYRATALKFTLLETRPSRKFENQELYFHFHLTEIETPLLHFFKIIHR